MTFSLDVRAHSEVGLVRKNNQDSGYASPTMLLVADGMGGAAAGDLASTVAVREILRSDGRYTLDQTGEVLAGALARANHTLADLVQHDPSLDGMGTTVCGALFTGTDLGLVHIGDSRGYLLRGGTLHRLTHDHSWVQSLVDEGKITEAEAAVHPHRSLLLKVLNGQANHEPDLDTVELNLGDRVLFCSDGLCGFVSDRTIRHIMDTALDLDEAMTQLVAAAHAGGGADNITILLADVMPQNDALDGRGAQLVGAVLGGEIPDLPEHTLFGLDLNLEPEPTASGERFVSGPEDLAVLDDGEATRYAPRTRRNRGRHQVTALVVGLVVLAAAAGGLYGGWRWSRTQYFVGQDSAEVAVFQGVPGSVVGLQLSDVAERTGIQVADLPNFFQQQVTATIPEANLDAAHATVQELRRYAQACIARRSASSSPSTSASATPSAAASSRTLGPVAPATVAASSSTSRPPASAAPSASASAAQDGDC